MSAPTLPRFHALQLEDQATVQRAFSAEEAREWCVLAGIETPFEHVPEPLIAGLFSYLLGEQLPGHGTNYLKQHMRFEDQGRLGETLTACVTVTHLRPGKALVNLDTLCTGEDGRVICAGDALVLFQQ